MEPGTRVIITNPEDLAHGETGIVTDVDTAPGGLVLLTLEPDGTPTSIEIRRNLRLDEVRAL